MQNLDQKLQEDRNRDVRNDAADHSHERERTLPPAARRALAEARERRRLEEERAAARPKEIQGRGGLDPARYGDWEVKGIASDF